MAKDKQWTVLLLYVGNSHLEVEVGNWGIGKVEWSPEIEVDGKYLLQEWKLGRNLERHLRVDAPSKSSPGPETETHLGSPEGGLLGHHAFGHHGNATTPHQDRTTRSPRQDTTGHRTPGHQTPGRQDTTESQKNPTRNNTPLTPERHKRMDSTKKSESDVTLTCVSRLDDAPPPTLNTGTLDTFLHQQLTRFGTHVFAN